MDITDRVASTLGGLGFRRLSGRRYPTFTGALQAGKISVPVEIEIPDWDFVEQPVVRIDESFLEKTPLRGHLAEGDVLCYSDSNTLLLDRYQLAESIHAVLDLATRTLKSMLHENTDHAIQAEITAYWKGKPYFLIDDPRSLKTGCVAEISWDETWKITVVADCEERLGEWCKKAHATYLIKSDAVAIQIDGDIPPPPGLKTYGEAIEWTRSVDTKTDTSDDAVFGSGAEKPPAVVIIGDNGVIGYAPVANALISQARSGKGFRPSSIGKLWRTEAHKLELLKFFGHVSNHLELVSRNLDQSPPLADKKIALVGCGTIGGYLARMLVQNGAGLGGALVLIDNQLFLPENVGRHILGIEFSGRLKSQSLAEYLNRDFPDADIQAVSDTIQHCWGQFREFDLVIDATGMEKVSSALNHHVKQMRREGSYPPVLYAMIFGNGIAVQTFLDKGGQDDACYKCLKPKYGEPWRFNPVKSKAGTTRFAVRPCSVGSYTPFGVEASVTAATLALRHVLDVFAHDGRPTLRTRAIVPDFGIPVGDKTVTQSDRCPDCQSI